MRLSSVLLLTICAACGTAFALAMAAAPASGVVRLDRAQALLQPDGEASVDAPVDLARRWDNQFAGHGGRAVYRLALPPHGGPQPMGIYFSRVGNQVLVKVNGTTVEHWGELGHPEFDAAKVPQMVVVPAALLHADRSNELQVETTLQPLRWGGLFPVRYGPLSAIEPIYDEQRRWRHSVFVVYAVSLAGMGGIAALLWWGQRDPLYGCFSLAALLGVVRDLDRVWPDVPLPWPVLGTVVAVCYACHLALMCRFTQMALGPLSRGMAGAINATLLLAAGLALLSFTLGISLLWTIGLACLVPVGLLSVWVVLREALHNGGGRAWACTCAGGLALAAGVCDLVLIRIGDAGAERHPFMPHAIFAFVLIMAGIVAERYTRSVADYRTLNATLSQRIADREKQLGDAFDALRAQQHEQAVSSERQRIMREIHDGVGSQLVGLLNMVTRPGAEPAALEQQVQIALDEMRMAVDSLQPVHDDLVTVLATLRYRLQPRLEAAGIAIVWDVEELPALRQLSPQAVLQVHRILLEAFTNVLKHASASQVRVQARWSKDDQTVMLQITDNGVGLDGEGARTNGPQFQGRGIGNMRARAAAIGAVLRVEPAAGGGVCVALDWPVEPDAG